MTVTDDKTKAEGRLYLICLDRKYSVNPLQIAVITSTTELVHYGKKLSIAKNENYRINLETLLIMRMKVTDSKESLEGKERRRNLP
jgi:hypothetical protein